MIIESNSTVFQKQINAWFAWLESKFFASFAGNR